MQKRAQAEAEVAAAATAKATADREARRLQKQADKDKATKEKAWIAAARVDPDRAEADAMTEGRVMSGGETEAVRLARWEKYGAPDTASEAEASADEDSGAAEHVPCSRPS